MQLRSKGQGFYWDTKARTWVVQASRTAGDGRNLRRCRRVRGTEADARAARKQMLSDLDQELRDLSAADQLAKRRAEAAATLGLDLTTLTKRHGSGQRLTMRQFLLGRWAEHVMVAQNVTTRRTTRTHVAYLSYYLGDRPLDEVDAAAVARLREDLWHSGPRSFVHTQAGVPRKVRSTTFTPTAVNRILGTLAAVLSVAEREGYIDRAPKVSLLPADNSNQIVAPSDEELRAILLAAKDFEDVAPLMREAIELAAETGMRAGEEFNLTWRSVDFAMGDSGGIRIEMQRRTTLVEGRVWRPKHQKFRVIPLTPRAREILLDLRARVPSDPESPVIPSRGGAPYNRIEAAPDRSGKGFFSDVCRAVGLGRKVRWHDLRHYFAVRALMRNVPMAVVSAWLGHSDINLTVKRYGRWAAEAREQWSWAKRMAEPVEHAPRQLAAADGGRSDRP